MRDNEWLKNELEMIWNGHFSDIGKLNHVIIRFGRNSRTRLGFIRNHPALKGCTEIVITGLFRDESVPSYVVSSVIAHELTHYAHGFFSPHAQAHRYPHQGNIVDTEMRKRGLGVNLLKEKKWLKEVWPKMALEMKPRTTRRRIRSSKPVTFMDIVKLFR